MDRRINKIKLYVKDTPNAISVKEEVEKILLKNNFEIVDNSPDLAISIGGDGTFLKMLHANNFNINLFYASINAGSLGFLSSIDSNYIYDFINSLNTNYYSIKDLSILNTKVYTNNEVKNYFSLNELTIRKSDFSTLKLDIMVNNKLLEKYNGDGLVISTPVGSTGYNEALGGCIIADDVKALLITPIAPINNKVYKSLNNSLVLSDKSVITIIPLDKNNICYLSDGIISNISFDKIECAINSSIKCIMPVNYDYIKNIKDKIIDTKE